MNRSEDSPISLTRIACPVCRTVNEYETLRPGSYVEEGTDTDFRPLTRRWVNPRYQSINPLLYFMATCATCFYTREFNRAFRENCGESESISENQRDLRMKHLAMLAEPGGVAGRLGRSLWPESFPVQTAICKLLLGVLDEHLLECPSNYDLARWYLRVAWLFRELHPHSGPDPASPARQRRDELERTTREMEMDVARLRDRAKQMLQLLHDQPGAAQKHPEDTQGPLRCRQMLQEINDQLATFSVSLKSLQQEMAMPADHFVGGVPGTGGEAFGDYASFTEFLRSLKLDSRLIPINENEALALSRRHYLAAFDSHGGIDSGNGAMLTAYLIGELSRRLARYDDAERYLDMARLAANIATVEKGAENPQSALARHIAVLAERQAGLLFDTDTLSRRHFAPDEEVESTDPWGNV